MQHVGQHEAALGVGVDDFDGLSRHRRDNVARPLRLAVGHILDEPDGTDHVDLGLARSECPHQPNDASGSGHVAFHVLHALRRLDRNAPAIEAHALADERYRVGAAFAAVPPHDHNLRFMRRALAHSDKRPHAEFLHRRHVKNLDQDTEFSQIGRAASELPRIEYVGRLVDQVTCQHDTVGEPHGTCPGLFGGDWVGAREIHLDLGRPFLAFLALGLIAIEAVRAQTRAEYQTGNLIAFKRARRKFGHNRRLRGSAGHSAHGDTAQSDKVAIFQVSLLANADHDQTRRVETRRRNDIESRSAFSGEPICSRGAAQVIADRGQNLLSCWPELQVFRTERNQNSAQAVK